MAEIQNPAWPDLVARDESGAYLQGYRCSSCGRMTLGRREVCPACWKTNTLVPAKLGRRGTLYSATRIHQGPAGFAGAYDVGYVDIEGGLRVFAHLKGVLKPGAEVALDIGQVKTDGQGKPMTGPIYGAA